MPATFERYGCLWPGDCDDLMVEFACIQKGGQWKSKFGDTLGLGLFEHYRKAQSLMWPEDDHNRWSDLILREILSNTITAILGPKDSGKTHGASKYALTDYFVFPEKTLVIISSTDLRGLEMRVWGDVKSLHESAKQLYPWLPGHVLESKHAICTDDIEEGLIRDMRKGCLCVPCLSSQGQFVGLGRYVGMKQERRRLIADECFPAGSPVITLSGIRPIESIIPGDFVLSAVGYRRVVATSKQTTESLLTIITKDGRRTTCTPTHQLLTQQGWKKACEINEKHYIMGPHECLSKLRKTNHQQKSVLSEMLVLNDVHSSRDSVGMHTGAPKESKTEGEREDAFGQSNEDSRMPTEGKSVIERNGPLSESERREWHWTHQGRMATYPNVSRWEMELRNQHREMEWQRIPAVLQGGFGLSRNQTGNRGGRVQSWKLGQSKAERPEEGQFPKGAWVDRVEIYKPNDLGIAVFGGRGYTVYNLQVEGHPSYCVNGFVVHNCQFMREGFLDAPANMNSGDFKGIFLGNPLGMDDPLDKVSEPKTGWTSLAEPEKTAVWENRWLNGKTINLVGTDSPNFDPETKDKYKYLINQKSIDNTIAFYTKDSLQYYSQCKGVRRSGINAHRVITREMCEQFGAFDDVIWKGTPITKIAGCDAAYGGVGGDRCVAGHIEFGEDIDGKIVIACQTPVIVPVSIKKTERPEDQIAQFVMDYCSANEIPPENFFFDATGRGSLGTSLARIWSANTEPIEFGGVPTNRPVSLDFYVLDPKSRERRLKLCNEHYSKFVTELWFTVRYVIEARQLRQLPEDVAREGYMREWILTRGDKIEVEKKSDTKLRMNRSPDMFDWLVTCVEGARRRGFKISKLANEEESSYARDWLDDLSRKQRELIHRRDLVYR